MQDNPSISELESCDRNDGLSFLDDPDASVPERWLAWKTWLEAVTGHHGHIKLAEYVPDMKLPSSCDPRLANLDRQARKDWLVATEQLFLKPVGLSLQDNPPICSPLLAGFCSVSDWLGSRCDDHHFSYHQQPENIEKYFEDKLNMMPVEFLTLPVLSPDLMFIQAYTNYWIITIALVPYKHWWMICR